ncbi:hypothetical protein AERO8C_20414 [Aeromonas veronii]|uniref:Uncharacterized protein n=1 Tax=Aeromonas veronii TaxID=654 RepID=A0A653L2X0_AERVE|nr:hypothetical protein AERO8C_20414 [Aeromonas veronii]
MGAVIGAKQSGRMAAYTALYQELGRDEDGLDFLDSGDSPDLVVDEAGAWCPVRNPPCPRQGGGQAGQGVTRLY